MNSNKTRRPNPPAPPEYQAHSPRHPHGRPLRFGRIFRRITELLAIALSFLGRSRIARFLTAKASMDVVVEVTARFGRGAGRQVSTFFAFLAAEPLLIAVFVTIVVVLLECILWILGHLRPGRRPRHG